jgi:hypothetical protein
MSRCALQHTLSPCACLLCRRKIRLNDFDVLPGFERGPTTRLAKLSFPGELEITPPSNGLELYCEL